MYVQLLLHLKPVLRVLLSECRMRCHGLASYFSVSLSRWTAGAWDKCSQTCASGQQQRVVTCVQEVSGKGPATLPDGSCKHLKKPTTTQICNNVACNPRWKVGPWKNVSKV